MREAGEVSYADVFRDGTGVAEFVCEEDATRAVGELDGARFRSHEGEVAFIRVEMDGPSSPGYGGPCASHTKRTYDDSRPGLRFSSRGHLGTLPASYRAE